MKPTTFPSSFTPGTGPAFARADQSWDSQHHDHRPDGRLTSIARGVCSLGVHARPQTDLAKHLGAVGLTSGFGTLVEEERALQGRLQALMRDLREPSAIYLVRLLQLHQEEVGVVLGLLEQRYRLLPEPDRFLALHSRLTLIAQERDLPITAKPEVVRQLMALHVDLQQRIEALIRHGDEGRPEEHILRQAAERHGDMAWTLRVLLQEDAPEVVEDHVRFALRPPEWTRPTAHGVWENEGGATGQVENPEPRSTSGSAR